jgi:hypothetical protein
LKRRAGSRGQKPIPVNAHPPELPALPSQTPRPTFRWLLFVLLLVAPAVLTCLAVLVAGNRSDLAPAFGFIGGALGGIASGIVLGIWVGRSAAMRVVLSLVFVAVCGVASISLSMFGCLASGFQLNFH